MSAFGWRMGNVTARMDGSCMAGFWVLLLSKKRQPRLVYLEISGLLQPLNLSSFIKYPEGFGVKPPEF